MFVDNKNLTVNFTMRREGNLCVACSILLLFRKFIFLYHVGGDIIL